MHKEKRERQVSSWLPQARSSLISSLNALVHTSNPVRGLAGRTKNIRIAFRRVLAVRPKDWIGALYYAGSQPCWPDRYPMEVRGAVWNRLTSDAYFWLQYTYRFTYISRLVHCYWVTVWCLMFVCKGTVSTYLHVQMGARNDSRINSSATEE